MSMLPQAAQAPDSDTRVILFFPDSIGSTSDVFKAIRVSAKQHKTTFWLDSGYSVVRKGQDLWAIHEKLYSFSDTLTTIQQLDLLARAAPATGVLVKELDESTSLALFSLASKSPLKGLKEVAERDSGSKVSCAAMLVLDVSDGDTMFEVTYRHGRFTAKLRKGTPVERELNFLQSDYRTVSSHAISAESIQAGIQLWTNEAKRFYAERRSQVSRVSSSLIKADPNLTDLSISPRKSKLSSLSDTALGAIFECAEKQLGWNASTFAKFKSRAFVSVQRQDVNIQISTRSSNGQRTDISFTGWSLK